MVDVVKFLGLGDGVFEAAKLLRELSYDLEDEKVISMRVIYITTGDQLKRLEWAQSRVDRDRIPE